MFYKEPPDKKKVLAMTWYLWFLAGFGSGVVVMAGIAVWAACKAAPYVGHEVYRE
jgi:hypothetical protein